MANTGIRQLTTVVGGYAKRIWYSLNGTTPTAELMSIDDAGNFKISGAMSSTMSNATKAKHVILTNSNLDGESSITFRQDTANDLAEISQIRNGYDGRLRFKTSDVSGVMNICVEVSGYDKAVKVASLAGTGNRAVYSDANGKFTNTSSDARVKKNVKNITETMNVLEVLKKIRGITYNWDNTIEGYENMGEQEEIGVIAQEIEQHIPQIVGENQTGYKSVDYAKLVAFLIETNKALLERIEFLESKVV